MKREQARKRLSGLWGPGCSIGQRPGDLRGVFLVIRKVVVAPVIGGLVNERWAERIVHRSDEAGSRIGVALNRGIKLKAGVKRIRKVVIVAVAEIPVQLRGQIDVAADDIVAPRVGTGSFRLEIVLLILGGARGEVGIRQGGREISALPGPNR